MSKRDDVAADLLEETLLAANALLRVAARTVIEVEDRVTSPQLRVLVLIARNGPQPPSAVATELDIHASNATRMCSRLERDGYIRRRESTEDRRVALFNLTKPGGTLVESVLDSRRAAIAEALERIPPAERPGVLAAFRTFATAANTVETADGRFDLTLRA